MPEFGCSRAATRAHPARSAAALVVCVASLTFGARLSAQEVSGTPAWPFAVPPGAAHAGMMDARDLWNLGVIGAKASDADAPPPAPHTSGMKRIVEDPKGKGHSDDGPKRLRVECLFPDGPAEKAGLKVGDVIVAVNGVAFEKASMPAFAQALAKAESGEGGKGSVLLRVEGTPPAKVRTINVVIAAGGREMAEPAKPQGRAKVAALALDWLAKNQGTDGGYPHSLSGANGTVVMASLAGLAWLGAGSLPGEGTYGTALAKVVPFIVKNLAAKDDMPGAPGGVNWNQDNWGRAYAAIFLGELHARHPTPEVKKSLDECAHFLLESQVPSGGWGHGPGGKNALGYIELNIVAGLALNGIGLAKQAGCRIDEAAMKRAAEYVEASSSAGEGGVGYSTLSGQKGMGNIGRSAASWLGYVNLGFVNRQFGASMKNFVTRHADDYLGGHASLMQHIMLAGVAAQAAGPEAEKKYWTVAERELILARAPDGSLQPRPWHESLSMGDNTDVSCGQVWTTASWAVVLTTLPVTKGVGGLPALCGRNARLPVQH